MFPAMPPYVPTGHGWASHPSCRWALVHPMEVYQVGGLVLLVSTSILLCPRPMVSVQWVPMERPVMLRPFWPERL